jgi:hypothetical protein
VWFRVPHDSEGKRLCLHGVREAVNVLVPRRLTVGVADYLRRVVSWLCTEMPRRSEYLNGRSRCQ